MLTIGHHFPQVHCGLSIVTGRFSGLMVNGLDLRGPVNGRGLEPWPVNGRKSLAGEWKGVRSLGGEWEGLQDLAGVGRKLLNGRMFNPWPRSLCCVIGQDT